MKLMDKFVKWFWWVTGSYLILFVSLLLLYGFFVPNGVWGSFSDVVIALFTLLISYSTTLLVVAASSWREQQKYQMGSEFLSKFLTFYFQLMECRRKEVLIYYIIDEINCTKEKAKDETYNYEEQINKLKSTKKEIKENFKNSVLKFNSDIEEAAKCSFIFKRSTDVLELMYEAQLIRSDFHLKLSPAYKALSKACIGKELQLPKIKQRYYISKYEDIVKETTFGYLQKVQDLPENEIANYTFDEKKWNNFEF